MRQVPRPDLAKGEGAVRPGEGGTAVGQALPRVDDRSGQGLVIRAEHQAEDSRADVEDDRPDLKSLGRGQLDRDLLRLERRGGDGQGPLPGGQVAEFESSGRTGICRAHFEADPGARDGLAVAGGHVAPDPRAGEEHDQQVVATGHNAQSQVRTVAFEPGDEPEGRLASGAQDEGTVLTAYGVAGPVPRLLLEGGESGVSAAPSCLKTASDVGISLGIRAERQRHAGEWVAFTIDHRTDDVPFRGP